VDARAAGISRRRCAAIGGLWRPQLTTTDSMRPYSTLPNRYSTTTIFPTTTQPPSNPDNHREPQPIHNRPSTACRTRTCKALLQPSNNHAPTILRVESMNDFDTTIHIRDSPNPTQPCINKKRRGKSAAPPVFRITAWSAATPLCVRVVKAHPMANFLPANGRGEQDGLPPPVAVGSAGGVVPVGERDCRRYRHD